MLCANITRSILLITSWACCRVDNCEWLAGQIPAVKAAARSQEVSQMPVGSVLSYIKMLTG